MLLPCVSTKCATELKLGITVENNQRLICSKNVCILHAPYLFAFLCIYYLLFFSYVYSQNWKHWNKANRWCCVFICLMCLCALYHWAIMQLCICFGSTLPDMLTIFADCFFSHTLCCCVFVTKQPKLFERKNRT